MNRRGFLSVAVGAMAAAAAFDPERELWVAGRKKIFIPPAPVPRGIVFSLQRIWVSSIGGDGMQTRMEMTLTPPAPVLMGDIISLNIEGFTDRLFRVNGVADERVFVAAIQNSR